MRLDTRARAVGRKVGDQTWIVALRNLLSDAPAGLADVEVEVDRSGTLIVTLAWALLTETRAEWWRDLEAALYAPRDAQEAELLASVISRLPWHPRKQRILRRLEGVDPVPVKWTAPTPAVRWAAPRAARRVGAG